MAILLADNQIFDFTSKPINDQGGTRITRIGNSGDSHFVVTLPDSIAETVFDVNNSSRGSFAGIQATYRTAGAPRAAIVQQRHGSGSGGQYIIKAADSGGALQNRLMSMH